MDRVADRLALAAANGTEIVDLETVDDPAEMRRLLDRGASGISTNRPDILMDMLKAGAA